MQSLTTTPLLSLLTFDLKVDFAWLIAWESDSANGTLPSDCEMNWCPARGVKECSAS